MKCIKETGGTIKRVSDSMARDLVDSKKATYIPKSEWKKLVRDKK